MNKKLLLVLFSFLCVGINAQSYRGYHTDNYSGMHAGLSNPALLKNNKLKMEFNLLSFDVLAANNIAELNFNNLLKFDFDNLYEFDTSNINGSVNQIIDIQLLGPSILFQVGQKGMLGLSTRSRAMLNSSDIDQDLANVLINGLEEQTGNINLTEDGFGIVENSWSELGLSYAREIYQNKRTRLNGGFTVKYLYGANAAAINTNNLTFEYTENPLPPGNIVNIGGELRYATNKDLLGSDDILKDLQDGLGDGSGFGGDIGFTYELKNLKTTEDDYSIRFAASVLDIGKINYKVTEQIYTLDNTVDITEEDFNKLGSEQSLEEFIEANYGAGAVSPLLERDLSFNLPTQLQLGADVKLSGKIYLNATSNIALTNPKDNRETKALTHHTVTPRYESKLLGFWSPIGVDEFNNFTWGAGLRFGPFFVGSGSALSALLSETKIIDAYAGLKIPINARGDKDSDQDGVPNKDDSCKRTPGPSENFGCPLNEVEEIEEVEEVENTDLDQDGVLNDVDECPNTKGTVANKGCPVSTIETIIGEPDTILISTPIKQIEKKIDGDTDMDGVMDSMDDCPTVFGTKENKGCPVTIKELEVFRQDVREVYFDTASSDVNLNSAARLKSAAVVMKKFPDMYWIVEGHSDSQGNEVYNQKLSEDRAKEVKNFFINNGIEAGKIDSYGYGESRPQTTNATAAGRAKNRRVEMRAADAQGKLVGLDLPKEDVVNEMSNLVKFVYFETGSDVIIDNSKSQLELIAYYMKKHAGKYEIQGHTDDVGSQETNMLLSEKRAKAVVKFLINEGVSAESLKAVGYGELSPVADNSTKDGQAENRRIEIKLSN